MMTWKEIMMIYILTVNAVTFCFYGIDKYKAIHHQWRISEFALLLLTFSGGSLGAYAAMQLFRHKTKHWKYRILVPLFLAVHILLGMVYMR